MSARDAVERVWPGRASVVEPLGAITRHNVKVVVGGEAFVLHLAGRESDVLGIDRRVEYEASLAASAVGVGPEVVALIEPEGHLITRFIDGEVVPPGRAREPATLRRVAQALRAVHAGPPLAARFSVFRVVEDYRSAVFAHGASVPPAYAWARQLAKRIERARGPVPERPCHNDLVNANIIDDGHRTRIVGWEYAGMGDVFFDLANFAVNHGLDDDERRLLLEAYVGVVRPVDERTLDLMRFMSDFREAMWGVLQGAVSGLDHDFAAYADRHFERMRQTSDEEDFQAALDV